MELFYLGHSGFSVRMGGKHLVFDPWLSKDSQMPRRVPPAASASQFRDVDAVFVSHEHFDHRDPSTLEQIVTRNMCQLIAPRETLEGLNVPERLKMAVSEGERFTVQGMDVQVVPAKHPQSVHSVGFIVTVRGQSVYHSGDTYDFFDLSTVSADVGLIPIGGTYTMDVLAAVTSLKRMRLKHVVPMHYNTFDNIQANPKDFASRVKQTKTLPHVMRPGESLEI